MGKKGTKRKTKWRALPLGEEAGGSGNEEDLHDEDLSTTSSVVGGHPTNDNFRRQSIYYKAAEKSFRHARRFAYDRFRSREPLVKLENKKFDEGKKANASIELNYFITDEAYREEYTKITTPRQDVLFKKGYFGRKRESSVEETVPLSVGEMDGEEPMMDQIIITNGFVDERGHYLVNGNSYEIYDPYSNTVTVVVGPPPYANGVTQPVLAAVSCHPVPLQPVDWYPPGADWPSQGSAWTPTYSRNPHPDSANVSDGTPDYSTADAPIPNLFNQPAYVVSGYAYGESPILNGNPPMGGFPGVPNQTNPPTGRRDSEGDEDENEEEKNRFELKKARRKSTDSVEEEGKQQKAETIPSIKEATSEPIKKNVIIAQSTADVGGFSSPSLEFRESQNNMTGKLAIVQNEAKSIEAKQVEKQSHSTQTNLVEAPSEPRIKLPGKESHSTQTPPEEFFHSNTTDLKAKENGNKSLTNTLHFSPKKSAWKLQGNNYGNPDRKLQEESPRRIFQQRTNFSEERKLGLEKSDSGAVKVSYAKKAMSGLENLNPKVVNGTSEKILNGGYKTQSASLNGMHQVFTKNGTNNVKQLPDYVDKKNGFVRTRYSRGKSANDRMNPNLGEKKFEVKPFDEPVKKCGEIGNEFHSHSEKSSTVSELSSPTELSSGQNTPPEKLIVQKMEEEINKNFEDKLKQNLSKTEQERKGGRGEDEGEEDEEKEESNKRKEKKPDEKPKGKKKKNKGKPDMQNPKEPGKGNKKKKKRGEEIITEKSGPDKSSEEIPFLSDISQKNLLFGSWEGLKDDDQDFISEMDSLLGRDREILKSLGLNDDKANYSKLPLHSDLLMMLPTFGWTRPKLKIEDFFVPASFHSDFFTKRNITNMKSTKPEEFFASVIDNPLVEKIEKRKEAQKKMTKPEESLSSNKKTPKTGIKISKSASMKASQPIEQKKSELEAKDGKLGIVEAVNTWLQEQGDSEKFISVENFENLTAEEENSEEEDDQKNGPSNPMHALSPNASSAGVVDFREGSGCIRVANVINDGFIHLSGDFPSEKKFSRMYRSSSWDAKLSEVNIKKHFKFLTDSASFCQDLISDVRNGLPTGIEYATEELCDPKQTVTKYYILAPNGRVRNESDSENEVFDALEYKFLTKDNQEADGKNSNGNGNASITDSGVHSDMESSEDNAIEQQKETTCKLQ